MVIKKAASARLFAPLVLSSTTSDDAKAAMRKKHRGGDLKATDGRADILPPETDVRVAPRASLRPLERGAERSEFYRCKMEA